MYLFVYIINVETLLIFKNQNAVSIEMRVCLRSYIYITYILVRYIRLYNETIL